MFLLESIVLGMRSVPWFVVSSASKHWCGNTPCFVLLFLLKIQIFLLLKIQIAVPVLCCAVLCCAVLCCAALRCAALCCAVLCCVINGNRNVRPGHSIL